MKESKEPQYYAYRADLKKEKVMYSIQEVMDYFHATKMVIRRKALGKVSGHSIGGNIGKRWFIFDSSLSHRYVQEYLDLFTTEDIDLSGHQSRQERKKKNHLAILAKP